MKRKLCMIIAILTFIVVCINIGFIAKSSFFYNLDEGSLPEGRFLREEPPVDFRVIAEYNTVIRIYEIDETQKFPCAVRATAYNTETKKERTIYWQIGTTASIISWPEIDDDDEEISTYVYINDVPVDFVNGNYDCRDFKDFTYVPTPPPKKQLKFIKA